MVWTGEIIKCKTNFSAVKTTSKNIPVRKSQHVFDKALKQTTQDIESPMKGSSSQKCKHLYFLFIIYENISLI